MPAILKVPEGSTATDLKKAYKKLALEHHPDKGGDTKKFQDLQSEYEKATSLLQKAKLSTINPVVKFKPKPKSSHWPWMGEGDYAPEEPGDEDEDYDTWRARQDKYQANKKKFIITRPKAI